MPEQVKEWRPPGSRNLIRVGDLVRVNKGIGDKAGFDAWVLSIPMKEGVVSYLNVTVAAPHRKAGTSRSITIDRIARKAQTKTKDAREHREALACLTRPQPRKGRR